MSEHANIPVDRWYDERLDGDDVSAVPGPWITIARNDVDALLDEIPDLEQRAP